jgi:dihydroorotate dehydrogenase electron transfer subunit
MPFDIAAPILRHEPIPPDHFLLTLEAPAIARTVRPGQFVMLQVREGRDPLLRRPMSVCRVLPGRPGRIQILYKVVGEGTRCLSRRAAGAAIRMLGPLGNGFTLGPAAPRARVRGARPILVAGGIGIAIFPFLAERLLRAGRRPLLLFGARTRHDLVGLPFFRARRIATRLATEDGSAGERGYVTRLLQPLLEREGASSAHDLYVCGPTPMMRAVAEIASRAGVSCQLALESQMPCGIGVCLGCVVRSRGGADVPTYVRVCTEGPVFEASRVQP